MDPIFMNSGNTKTSDRHRLNLSAKIDLKRSDKYVLLYSIKSYHIQYMEKHQKVMQKKKKIKVSATIWNEVVFCIRYSVLFSVYHQETRNSD